MYPGIMPALQVRGNFFEKMNVFNTEKKTTERESFKFNASDTRALVWSLKTLIVFHKHCDQYAFPFPFNHFLNLPCPKAKLRGNAKCLQSKV